MKRIIPVLLLAGIVVAAGFWLVQRNNASPQLETISAAKQVYVCPMHSNIVRDHPGTCPICGMDLVLTGHSDAGTQIHVDTATQQKFGVRLAAAELNSINRDIHTYATITPDLNSLQRISPTISAVLVKLYANYPGQHIGAGEPLYEIFSQELLDLQNEYIDYIDRRSQSLKSAEETRARNREMLKSMHENNNDGNEQMTKMMRQSEDQIRSMLLPMERDGERLNGRLKYIGFNKVMLHNLEKTRKASESVIIRAQHACTVYAVNARAGMALNATSDIVTCAEPDRAWLEVVLYPDQTEFVKEGESLEVEFADGSHLQTKLTGLSNVADATSRTLKAHIPIKLAAGQQLGDYADVTLHGTPREVLTIPVSAVIRSGHGNFVMHALGNGHFMPQKVITGIANDERIGIIEGLDAGDKVAVNGQFLLDAAASIADAAQRYKQDN